MEQDIIKSLKKKYQGKNVLVVGLGLQGGGIGLVRFFAELGAYVTVTDKKNKKQLSVSINQLINTNVNLHLAGHQIKDFLEADIIFKGPSVLWTMPEIIEAEKKEIPVELELSFFAENFPGKIIGVTGARGKSTTTQLIFNLLKLSGFPVYIGGGIPGISTINYLKTLTKNDWVVMEISSWALSGFHRKKISPHIAILTNIYPDHLNYYRNMDEYLYDKKAIYLYQNEKDYLVINDSLLRSIDTSKSKIIPFNKGDFPFKLNHLKGEHNLENAAAALKVAEILNINKDKAVKIISNFQGLPYRQEIIGDKDNVTFVNDTTSTTPIATIKAIDSFKDKKIILILGGNSKNLPFNQLINQLDKIEKIVLLAGSFTDEILDTLRVSSLNKLGSKVYDNLEEAVNEAYRLAKKTKGSYVLFSPGATSFAMFNNEFHRGEEFNRVVKKILRQ